MTPGRAAPLDYAGALEFISATGRFGIKMGLERTRALLDELGAPDRGLRGVLVGGTNGKGSTCAFLVSILLEAGLRVGSMPKPHLQSYTERVQVDGEPISEAGFADLVSRVRPAVEKVARVHGDPTEFEILTAAALLHLAEAGIDLLVCEVGMGGRLDSTNVLDLGVKVITGVDLDHQRYLGDTVEAIAAEKAGIIRAGDSVVVGRAAPGALAVIEARVAEVGAVAARWGREITVGAVTGLGWAGSEFDLDLDGEVIRGLRTGMLGDHQVDNAAVAVAACSALGRRHRVNVGRTAIGSGLAAARWPGRMEVIGDSPRLIIDGAHNPAAVAALVTAVGRLLGADLPVVVFGAMADKDWTAMIRLLPPQWPAIFTAVDDARAEPPESLLATATAIQRPADSIAPDAVTALAAARRLAGDRGTVLVLGSLYLAGEVRAVAGG